MEIYFNEKYLEQLYTEGVSDKKHRYQPQIIRKYIRIIDLMIELPNVQSLLNYNSLNYEKLKGNKVGLSSVRVNDQYRIEFEEKVKDGEILATICNITDSISKKMDTEKKTEMCANQLKPAYPTHPGEILKEEIEYRGISQRKLAEQMGMQYSVLNEILNAHRPLTEKTALLFEAALGVEAEPLMRLQLKYNMQTARKDQSFMEKLAQVRKIAAML